jgi:predicted dehydrogenase
MTDWFPASNIPPLRGGPTLRWGVLGPGTIGADDPRRGQARPHRETEELGQEIADAASGADRLAAEAMWTRYLPQFDVLRQVLDRGDIGDVRLATADVGWQTSADMPPRSIPAALGGGAALDMGVYGYWFAHFAIGPAVEVRAVGSITDSGVDDQSVVALRADGGRQASVTTSMSVTNSGMAGVYGISGRAQFLDPFVFPGGFVVHTGAEIHHWRDTSGLTARSGLAWQAADLAQWITNGVLDSPAHSLQDAVDVLRVIDEVRRSISSGWPTARPAIAPETETIS